MRSKSGFNFTISVDAFLTIDDIWPDGDAPKNPTLDDVLAVIAKDGGARKVMHDWSLLDDVDLEISDDTGIRVAP